MSDGYRVWTGSAWDEVPVPLSGGEGVVVPIIAGIVFRGSRRDEILLQRRDKAGEPVRGRLELPGGRWRAGELPDVALAREVAEETGVQLLAVSASIEHLSLEPNVAFGIGRPVAVVNGTEGAYPALHVLFECRGIGRPRPESGKTTEPAWWLVEKVLGRLAQTPEDFVWSTRAMLVAYFGD